MTPQIRVLAVAYVVFASLALLAGLALVIDLALGGAQSLPALQFVGPFYLLIGGFTLLPMLIGGLGLLARRSWARWLMVVISIPYLFAFPVGTALGGLSLWALLAPSSFPRANAEMAGTTPRSPILSRDRTNLVLVIAATGLAIVIALGIGFRINQHAASSTVIVRGPDGRPVPAYALSEERANRLGLWTGYVPLIIAGCALAGVLVIKAPEIARRRGERQVKRRQLSEFVQRHAARIAELEADPVRRAYAARVAKGESWSDAQIDYDLDIDAVASCIHLQPAEAAMRRAGIQVRLVRPLQLDAKCRIDEAGLKQHGLLEPPAAYLKYYETERSYEDNPTSRLVCRACPSAFIWVVHPNEAGPDVPVFGG